MDSLKGLYFYRNKAYTTSTVLYVVRADSEEEAFQKIIKKFGVTQHELKDLQPMEEVQLII